MHYHAMTDQTAIHVLEAVAEMQRVLGRLTEAVIARSSGVTATAEGPVVLPREGTQPERVLSYMLQRPSATATRRELRRAFPDMNDNSLSGALTRLKHTGRIETFGRGRYRVSRRS